MLSSSCEFARQWKTHSSACYHHLVLWLPNEDFGRMNKRGNHVFRSHFQGREYSIWAKNRWKVSRQSGFHLLFILPKSSFGEHRLVWVRQTHRHAIIILYCDSQTKILEGWTKEEIMCFEAIFKGVSTRFGLRIVEKSVDNPDFIFCSSFQNLRLVSIDLCEFDRHIGMLSSGVSCEFEWQMICCTAGTHAPFTRLARTPGPL